MRSKQLELGGWGRTAMASVSAFRPERVSAAADAVKALGTGNMIAYGGGRSYGDTAIRTDGAVLMTERLDRILAFDEAEQVIVCEPGISVADMQAFLVPRGYMLPAVPGTGFATIGGLIANDVHGKNHDRHGSFGDHVCWFDLLMADGTVTQVAPESDGALFSATIGGAGLTGIIVTVCAKVLPISSNAVQVTEMRVRDLNHFFELFAEHRDRATYSVGWIDALARGAQLGRGVLELADPSPAGLPAGKTRTLRVPFDMPGMLLNRLTMSAFNALYYRRAPAGGEVRQKLLTEFFHPLDALHDWNRIYGRAGFHQFQCVVPEEGAPSGIRRLLEEISASGSASFLAVLKTMGGEGRGHLSFPMRGYTLALDFPARAAVTDLLRRLEDITLDYGGRIYLAKDSVMSEAGFARMYPALREFRAVLDRVDPNGMFVSDQALRLGIRGPGR